MKKNSHYIKAVVIIAMMTALGFILDRIVPGVKVWNLKLSFTFIPVCMTAILYGPFSSAVCWGLIDLIGALLMPFGAYFPGYTLTCAISGFIMGIFILSAKRKNSALWLYIYTAIGCVIRFVFCSMLLDTYWIYLQYSNGRTYTAILLSRALLKGVFCIVEIAVIPIVFKLFRGLRGKLGV